MVIMKKFNESDYTYKANNNKLLNESSFTIEEFCYDNDIEDPRTFIRILRQLCDFDDIEQADNSLLRKALVKYRQTLKESSDYIYKAKIGDKLYLQGNSQDGWDTTSDPDEAAIFESKTEPTQIINQMKKDGKIRKNDKITVLSESISDFKGHLLFGTAVLGLGALSAIDHNKIKSTADKLGIELAETEYGSHQAAGLVGPIYEYKYGMKGPMDIDSLCEYLKNHTDFDEITYEDEGDNYVINYTDNYTILQTGSRVNRTRHKTSKGNFKLPKEYFDVSFVLDEARVFSHSSGFGFSGHYNDYEAPRKEPLYIATETNEDDGELYFDERGCTTEFKTDAKRFTSEEDALEFAKNNVIFGEPGAKLYEKSEENTIYKKENTMKKLNELSEFTGRNIIYVIKGIFECNGKEKTFYYNKSLDNWSEYLVNPDPTQLGNATQFKSIPKDETLEAASDAANNRKRCAVRFEDPDYELVDIIILELKKSRYGFSKVSQRSWPDGKNESLSESSQLFENRKSNKNKKFKSTILATMSGTTIH